MTTNLAALINGHAVPLSSVPVLGNDEFGEEVLGAVASGQRVAALFGFPAPSQAIRLCVVLADDRQSRLHVAFSDVVDGHFASLASRCPQVQLFEREVAEQFGLHPEGHPWLKPVRYHHSWTGRDAWGRAADEPIPPAVTDFYRVAGEEVHEVAVGPVHAGVIEPGHFRFQCHGERVFHLEIALGFQHRGVEEALAGGPHRRSIHHAATLSGDATVAHTSAYCQMLEGLSQCQVPPRAQLLRAIGLELERLANHVGDLGALANDVGFLPSASFCGRIRGDFLNMTALLCGSRFGRTLVRPGGLGHDVDADVIAQLQQRLDDAERDTISAVELLWNTPSVMARFEETGVLPAAVAQQLGLVGPAARASGLSRDVRHDHPSGIFRFTQIPVSTMASGDVFARAHLRWLEIQQSVEFLRDQLASIPPGPIRTTVGPAAADHLAVTVCEGWRGEVCHVAVTDEAGCFRRYKVMDPSFHNWAGLAHVLRDQEISDFPICNKSFNLSYCGHDL